MNITYRIDEQILYIAVEGRIDVSNAAEAEAQIDVIKKQNPGKHTVLDADKLEYISSAGLRVILKLRKEEPKLAIINVSPEVYEIFDMTGFTDMVTIEKAYRKMSVDGCEFIATTTKPSSRFTLQRMPCQKSSKNAKMQDVHLFWVSTQPFPMALCALAKTTAQLPSF